MEAESDGDRQNGKHGQDCGSVLPPLDFAQTVAGHDHRTDGTDRAGLVHGCHAGNDRTQHQEDQGQRRHQRHQHLAEKRAIEGSRLMHRRRGARLQEGEAENEQHVETDENQTRNEGSEEHFAGTGRHDREVRRHGDFTGRRLVEVLAQRTGLVHRACQLVGENDQHDRRRDDLSKRTGCGDRAGRQRHRILVAHHGGQGNQAHRHDRGADDTRGRREKGANENDRNAQTAGDRTEQLRHGHEQIFSDLGPLQHDAHEHEQRNGDQRISLGLPIDPSKVCGPGAQPLAGSALGKEGVHVAGKQIADNGRDTDGDDGGTGQREGHRKAGAESHSHHHDKKNEKEEFHELCLGSATGRHERNDRDRRVLRGYLRQRRRNS